IFAVDIFLRLRVILKFILGYRESYLTEENSFLCMKVRYPYFYSYN
ncbi:unnamed protein product, partial [Rotaria magnacalcarata]